MTKRIIAIISTVFVIVLSVMPFASAQDESYSFIPDSDGQPIYEILPLNSDYPTYTIYGATVGTVDNVGANNRTGFIWSYLGDPSTLDGTYSIPLYDEQSTLMFTSRQGDDVACNLIIQNSNNGLMGTFPVFSYLPNSQDFTLIASNNGNIMYYIYNYNTGVVISSGVFNVPLYGNIFIKDKLPSSASYDEGYDDGYSEGLTAGENIGYTEGFKDGSLATYDETLVYNRGYETGYQKGKSQGLQEGLDLADEDIKQAYNAGLSDGQMQAGIIPQAIDGFFNAMLSFFRPFLSIGIGSLTLYSLLGIIIVVGVVMVIVKITRG